MKIIQSNTPEFIDSSEHNDYKEHLLKPDITYFLLFHDSNPVACGGYGLNQSKTKAGLAWGLVFREYHNQGYGNALLQYRLEHIKRNFTDIDIYLDTSQKTFKFFEKFGFEVEKIIPDGYAQGLDRYNMVFKNN